MRKFGTALFLIFLGVASASAEDAYQRLDKLYKARQFDSLEAACQNDLKENPKSLLDLYFLSLEWMNQGKVEKAVPVMMEFEKVHDELEAKRKKEKGKNLLLVSQRYADLYFVLGQYHTRHQEYGKALPWLKRSQSRFSDDPNLYFFLGRCYAGKEDWAAAEESFDRQMELDPKDPSPLYNLASSYARQGKTAKALHWLQKAVQAKPFYKETALKDESFEKLADSKEFKKLTAP